MSLKLKQIPKPIYLRYILLNIPGLVAVILILIISNTGLYCRYGFFGVSSVFGSSKMWSCFPLSGGPMIGSDPAGPGR